MWRALCEAQRQDEFWKRKEDSPQLADDIFYCMRQTEILPYLLSDRRHHSYTPRVALTSSRGSEAVSHSLFVVLLSRPKKGRKEAQSQLKKEGVCSC